MKGKPFLTCDPFSIDHACDYCTRPKFIQEKLETDGKSIDEQIELLVKNFLWVAKRAMIVLLECHDEKSADAIWKMDLGGFWRKWFSCVPVTKQWRCIQARLMGVAKHTVIGDAAVVTEIMEYTKKIHEFVWDVKQKDIYKKLKGYQYLQYCPKPEILCPIDSL